MKKLTSGQLFAPPKKARKTKTRLERAKLVIVAARERAAVTAERYAAIRANLERRGLSISEQDLLVAAVALDESGIVVTNNVAEFQRIPGLQVTSGIPKSAIV